MRFRPSNDHPSLFADPAPTVLDLFSGCGGISLGFDRAGFEVVGGVELSPEAARTHARNFHGHLPGAARDVHARARDITGVEPLTLLDELGQRGPVDVLVGGPPCQAYARVGRAKLREVMDHPEAFTLDDRGNLFLHYLRFVEALRPRALLMENVPDILNYGGRNVAEEIAVSLEELGYDVRYTLLNAANYGVPQLRERFYLMALRTDAGALGDNPFPRPTHEIVDLPPGYAGTRSVATKILRSRSEGAVSDKDVRRHLVRLGAWSATGLPPAVTAKEALADLPPIREHLDGTLTRGARRFSRLVRYLDDVEPSPYAREMRSWPGFESTDGVWDHVIRKLPRDYRIFRAMAPGDQYPQAFKVAERLFEEEVARCRVRGEAVDAGGEAWAALRKTFVPPYDANKFPNKWRKMEANRPARTLMAHLGKDSYSHIHYDDAEARTISVREAARLQSFPDGFTFEGTMNPAFRQIGNAVPPKVSFALAASLRALLDAASRTTPVRLEAAL